MKATIYLIRHGEVYNPNNILYGRLPGYGLSDHGQEQLLETADYLSDKTITAIYTSPLLRARQSAEILQRILGSKLSVDEALIETKTAYMGRPFTDFDELQSEVYLKPKSQEDETLEQIGERLLTALKQKSKEHANDAIAVVSHGDPLMTVKALIEKKPLDLPVVKAKPYIRHGEVWKVDIDDESMTLQSVFFPTK
jgi:broad specificity phosphatase PhoE